MNDLKETDKVLLDRYKALACEVLRVGFLDYVSGYDFNNHDCDEKATECYLRLWVKNNIFFDLLDIDRELFINRAIEERNKRKNAKKKHEE